MVYANDNPYRFLDPDGQCSKEMSGSETLCGVQDAITDALEPVVEASMELFGVDVVSEEDRDPEGTYDYTAETNGIGDEVIAIGVTIVVVGTVGSKGKKSKVTKSTKTETIGGKYTKKTETRLGNGPGQSRAEYVRYKNKNGEVIRTHKDSYDRTGKFQHRKPLTGGPEGRK